MLFIKAHYRRPGRVMDVWTLETANWEEMRRSLNPWDFGPWRGFETARLTWLGRPRRGRRGRDQ